MIGMLIQSIERQAQAGTFSPVIGVGHSFGGAIMCCAASRRPDLFKKLVLVDPPMFRPAYRSLAYVASSLLDAKLWHPLVAGAARRRNWWKTRDAARAYLRTRGIFAQMHPDSLDAFIQHALVEATEERGETEGTKGAGETRRHGVRLLFPPEAEAAIFESFPLELPFLTSKCARVGQASASEYRRRVSRVANATYCLLDR